MMNSWTCLMVEKGPGILSDRVRGALESYACKLHLDRVDRIKITSPACGGYIQTEWKTYTIGMSTGVFFRCQVEIDGGDCLVNFLLNKKDLEVGAETIREMEENGPGGWNISQGRLPVDELYVFYDLRPHNLN